MQKREINKMEFYFSPFTKIYSRWITDLNVNGIIKFLEDNIRGNLSELRFGNDFLDIIKSKVHERKKNDKLDFNKNKNF